MASDAVDFPALPLMGSWKWLRTSEFQAPVCKLGWQCALHGRVSGLSYTLDENPSPVLTCPGLVFKTCSFPFYSLLPILPPTKAKLCFCEDPFVMYYSACFLSVAKSCPTLCDPWTIARQNCSVHGILQARILEWVAVPFSRGSSQPRDWTQVSRTADRFFTTECSILTWY